MSVTVQASRHPLKPDWVYADVAANQSVYEIAGGAPVTAYINGREVPEELHRLTKVKEGSHLTLWPIPQDGAGDVLRVVATVAVAAVAFPAAMAIAGTTAATAGFGTYAIAAGISLAGNYAINALIPPPTPSQPNTPEAFNRLESITGTSNRVTSFKPIPRPYGTFRYFPPIPMTARPYTEIQGDDQYLRMFLCLGYGPLEIGGKTVGEGHSKITEQDNLSGTPVRIGETDIELFDEVEYEIGTPDQMTIYSDQIIETDPAFSSGFNDVNELSQLTDTVISEKFGIALFAWNKQDNESAIRTTEADTDEISISVGGQLFSVDDQAKTKKAQVLFKIEYRAVGDTDWIVEEPQFTVTSTKKETVRAGYRWKVPRGQYEVRLTRISTSHFTTKRPSAISNNMVWNALRSIRTVQPFDVDGTVCMALRIKATDQLNGRIDDLSIEATSVLDVYDGSTWSPQATNNPAWIYADIWTGTANRRPIAQSDLDADSLLEWADYCDQEGLEYNGIFDATGTTFERATEVAATGLANWNFSADAKIGVVRDIPQTIPKMIISPRNSFAFNYELAAVEVPDALRVRFVDKNTYENTERLVFDDGFDESNAQKYETLEAKGVTDPDQAWKFGRYHLAQQRLRPERYNFKQDVQHLRYQRGDMLTIQYDTILVGLGAARIKEVVSDTEIVLDEIFIDNGESYGVKIQHSDGSVSTVTCTLGSGLANKTVFLSSSVTKASVDDLVIFGEAGRESIDVKVTAIEPEGNFIARITTVPAADEIEQAFEGEIPAFNPVLTAPVDPSQIAPRQPIIESIRSDENALYADDDGSLRVRMLVETVTPAQEGWDQKTQLRFRPVGDNNWESTEVTSSKTFSLFNVDEGFQYEVQARGVKDARFSPWTESTIHTVVGKSTPPPDVAVLNAVQNDENVVFRWSKVVAPDIDGYEIRYGPRKTATWSSSIKIAEATKSTVSTEADVPPGDFKFFIKAVDTAGNFSRAAASKELLVTTLYEDVRRTVHNPDWDDGEIFGFVREGTALKIDSSTTAYYKADTVDLGFNAKNVRVWANVGVGQSDVEEVDDYGLLTQAITVTDNQGLISEDVEEIEDYGGILVGLSVSDPNVSYEISTRNEGEDWPNESEITTYGKITDSVLQTENYGLITDSVEEQELYDTLMTWTQWSKGQIDARYIKQRVSITATDEARQGTLLRSFETVVDVPEKIEVLQEKTVDPGGTRFEFDQPFHFRPVVTATVESDSDLFAIRKNLDTEGVTFVVRDSDGNDVGADKLDIIARGY